MSDHIEINAPIHGYDPVSAYADRVALGQELDLSVADRCPEIMRQTLSLIARFGDAVEDIQQDEEGLISVSTPPFTYKTPHNNIAVLRIVANFEQPGIKLTNFTDLSEGAWCDLLGGSPEEQMQQNFITLSAGSVRTHYDSLHGRHHDLNFMQGVVSSLNDVLKAQEAAARKQPSQTDQ